MANLKLAFSKKSVSKTENDAENLSPSEILERIAEKGDLVLDQTETNALFLQTKHKAADALKVEDEITGHVLELLSYRKVFKKRPQRFASLGAALVTEKDLQAKDLIDEFKALANEVREDRRALEQKEKDRKFDPFKFFMGAFIAPVAAYTFLKTQFPKEEVLCRLGQGLVAVGGAFHSLRYQIEEAWEWASDSVTRDTLKEGVQFVGNAVVKDMAPTDIKNCFPIYYAKKELENWGAKAGEMLLKGAYPSVKELEDLRLGRVIRTRAANDKNEL